MSGWLRYALLAALFFGGVALDLHWLVAGSAFVVMGIALVLMLWRDLRRPSA